MKEPSLVGSASVDDEHSVPSSPDEADANDNTNQRRESGTVSPSPAPARRAMMPQYRWLRLR